VKNPVNYPFRAMRREQQDQVRKGKMKGRKEFKNMKT
jgi:hypothetical protein